MDRSDEKPTTRLFVLTPERVALDEAVTAVRIEQPDGWRGLLPGHAPFLSRLVNGVLIYRLPQDPAPHYLALFGGTLQVLSDKILVLTAAAEQGNSMSELLQLLDARQAEADALAFQAHIEFTQMRIALVRALQDLPPADDVKR